MSEALLMAQPPTTPPHPTPATSLPLPVMPLLMHLPEGIWCPNAARQGGMCLQTQCRGLSKLTPKLNVHPELFATPENRVTFSMSYGMPINHQITTRDTDILICYEIFGLEILFPI